MAKTYAEAYQDSRVQNLEKDRLAEKNAVDWDYEKRVQEVDRIYRDQSDGAKAYEESQKAVQQEEAALTQAQLQQQAAQTEQDYRKEQSAAYTDYQKQTGDYGVSAEAMADAGLTGSGYSESVKAGMYNAYQNRVAAAREVYTQAVQNYENAIREAARNNSAALAQIAYQALKTQLELTLEGLGKIQQLRKEQAAEKLQIDRLYDDRIQEYLETVQKLQGR